MNSTFHRAGSGAAWGVPSDKPLLILNDPWLEPYQEPLEQRLRRFNEVLAALGPGANALAAYANGHKYVGIHCNAKAGHWSIREWAPAARAVSLIGDFNAWNRESHPLKLAENGIWQLQVPAGTLDHGQLVKLHVVGADERSKVCVR